MSAAAEITRKAKSNLAFALRILPPERREDMRVFYAFCRRVDDLADDTGLRPEHRATGLDEWKIGLISGFNEPDELQRDLLEVRDRHGIPNDLLLAIIDGCRMDLHPRPFATWNELADYIWKVACAVGLVSIRLFGCKDPGSADYAVALGKALQLTNILRDVREDLENGGRIYLPLEDLARFEIPAGELANHVADARFRDLMAFEADRAEGLFRQAAALLPATDRKELVPARIMAEVYQGLLHNMRSDGFRVFENRYRVSSPRKFWILSKHLIARCV